MATVQQPAVERRRMRMRRRRGEEGRVEERTERGEEENEGQHIKRLGGRRE